MSKEPYISLDDLPKLKRLYNKAVKEGKNEFIFKGFVILTDYAKYAVKYLESMKRRINNK